MATSTTAASSAFIHSLPSYKYRAKPHHTADKMLESHCAQLGKGFLQPHRNNLPRRRKLAPPKLTLEPPVLVSVSVPFPVTATPPRNPLPPLPSPVQINTSTTHHGPLQPHISHLPRRRRLHTRHYHALAPARRRAKLERDMCLQRVSAGVWVGFIPDRVEPSSSEDDDFGGGPSAGKNDWDVGLEERFSRIVRIAGATTEVSPPLASTSSLTLTVEEEGAEDHGITLLTDAQIQQACVFLHSTSTTSPCPSSTHPRYSSFPSPSSHKNTKRQCLILTPRSRAVDALSLAAAYVVGRGQVTPPTTPLINGTPPSLSPLSMTTINTTPLRFPNKTNSEEEEGAYEPTPSPPSSNPIPDTGSALDDALRSDLIHPIAEWSAGVVPSRALQLEEGEEEEGYTPIHVLFMTLHDLAVEERKEGDLDEGEQVKLEEQEEEEERGLRDEWRGAISEEGMRRVWGVWCSSTME